MKDWFNYLPQWKKKNWNILAKLRLNKKSKTMKRTNHSLSA